MNLLRSRAVFFGMVFVFNFSGGALSCLAQSDTSVRRFDFTYSAKIPEVPTGAKTLRLWIPLPSTDEYQTIADLKVESPFPYTKHRETEYGNEYVYVELPARAAAAATASQIRVRFQVTRREHRVPLDAKERIADPPAPRSAELQRFLQPDRLVPLQGVIADLSAQQTKGIEEPLAKARAVYDYVEATMRYDKSGTGWGNGDAIWACTAKRGNCTDFHSLFIGMLRAAGIPARFEIGFPLPPDQHGGTIPGYHCWAQFYLPPYGWIPVDASEAWKHPDKKSYFFGAHDVNRVQFTIGRDIRLVPAQAGQPLNYFVYPYAELDGKPFALQSEFSFQDTVQTASKN